MEVGAKGNSYVEELLDWRLSLFVQKFSLAVVTLLFQAIPEAWQQQTQTGHCRVCPSGIR